MCISWLRNTTHLLCNTIDKNKPIWRHIMKFQKPEDNETFYKLPKVKIGHIIWTQIILNFCGGQNSNLKVPHHLCTCVLWKCFTINTVDITLIIRLCYMGQLTLRKAWTNQNEKDTLKWCCSFWERRLSIRDFEDKEVKWQEIPWASLVAQTVKNLPTMRETWVWSLDWEDPLEEGMATHSSILVWRISHGENPMDSGAWQTTAQRVAKNRTWLSRLSMHNHAITVAQTALSEQGVLWEFKG